MRSYEEQLELEERLAEIEEYLEAEEEQRLAEEEQDHFDEVEELFSHPEVAGDPELAAAAAQRIRALAEYEGDGFEPAMLPAVAKQAIAAAIAEREDEPLPAVAEGSHGPSEAAQLSEKMYERGQDPYDPAERTMAELADAGGGLEEQSIF